MITFRGKPLNKIAVNGKELSNTIDIVAKSMKPGKTSFPKGMIHLTDIEIWFLHKIDRRALYFQKMDSIKKRACKHEWSNLCTGK